MKEMSFKYPADKKSLYRILKTQLQGLADGVTDLTANLANVSALLNQALSEINWVGFYLMKEGRLILGPFQGKPACVEILVGQGVCGKAVETDGVMLVEDVHEFPGHIACNAASRSEIVVPVIREGKVIAVLDIDSDKPDSFDEVDANYLERICGLL